MVKTLVKKPPAIWYQDQDMHSVMEKFDITQSWYLPVLDKEKRFLGFVSKTKDYNKYREFCRQTLTSTSDCFAAKSVYMAARITLCCQLADIGFHGKILHFLLNFTDTYFV